jgi:cell wall-associated NlpC family hydrolase
VLRAAALVALAGLVAARAAAAGSYAEVVSPHGKVIARAAGTAFDYPRDGSLVHVGQAAVGASGVRLRDVRLLGGRIIVQSVGVPFDRGAISLAGTIVDGRPLRVTPNRLIPFGTLGYAILAQTAETANGSVGRVGVRLVLGAPVVGAPAGTQALVGLPSAAPPVRARRRQLAQARLESASPFLVLGFTGASAPVPDFLPAPELVGATLGERAAAIALRYLGIPYVWAGASPAVGFDCSGLVMFVYGQLGVQLTHYSGAQWHEGAPVALGELEPGDLVFFYPSSRGPQHVGMYIGNGEFVHAPHRGDVVKISSLADPSYRLVYAGAVRPYSG